MENNITDSSSRVTRSLRKRIASVDSDNSSRPGTPVAPKLSSITEISASPSRSTRMSRRNSSSGIATPVKTPAKRALGASSVITESAEIFTPARRSTRRRSVSTNEDEATPQSSLKVPSFPALFEEILSVERNTSTAKKITRCQSKSPQQFNANTQTSSILNCSNKVSEDDVSMSNSSKRRKPGPKCKTRRGDEEDEASDVEISVVGKGIDEIKSKSSNITTIILTDDDSNQINNVNTGIFKEQEENNTGGDSTVNITDMLDIIADNSNSYELKGDLCTQRANRDDNLNKFVGLEELIEKRSIKDESDKQIEKHTIGENKFLSNASTLMENINKEGVRLSADGLQESDNKKIDESMIATSEMNCLVLKPDVEEKTRREVLDFSADNKFIENKKQNATPQEEKALSTRNDLLSAQEAELLQQQQEKLSDNKIEIINICTLSTYNNMDDETDCKTSSKTVDFASNLGIDLNNKNVYPKTPVPTKTKFSDNNDSFRGSHDVPEEDLSQVDTISRVAVNINETKTTPRGSIVQNVLKVQSSTPISVDTLCYASLPEIEKTLINHDKSQSSECINIQVGKENLKETAAAPADSVENGIHLKWINPSVKGVSMEGSKLDVMNFTENENVVQEISEIENEYRICDDDELQSVGNEYEREDDFVSEDDELTTEVKEHTREQDDFLDDEAMAIEDYESGDSMESEERKEIMDNEILVDGESIGSHTTDDENNERIEEENSEDSFIVSDNEDLQCFESSDENKQTDANKDDDHHCNSRKKKKIYKRLQCPTESSSSDDEVRKCQSDDETTQKNIIETFKNDQAENNSVANHDNYKHSENGSQLSNNANREVIDKNPSEIKFVCNTYARQNDHLSLDSSKLSDSALRLHCSAESETEEQKIDKESIRKQIVCKLNHSDRFNKSVRDLNMEIEMSSAEDLQNRSTFDLIEVNSDTNKIEIIKADSVSNNNCENNIKEKLNCYDNKEGSHLANMLVITESDDDKENEHETQSISDNKKLESGLSMSFDTYKPRNRKEKKERQHSFSVDMIPKSETSHFRPSEISKEISILISPSPSSDQTLPYLKKEDIKYLENICHVPLPLGNPLVRTRRQSLALPTNPNMEICSSYGSEPNTKTKRQSLGILPNSDFNPSQSLIDTIELHKSHNDRQVFKRKHMSKSFCGASETLDDSVIDIDVQHLNKRSKIISEKSITESSDNTSKKVKSDKLPTKTSPTPSQKSSKKGSKFNIQTILNRCDEILEAANQTKREAKTNCKKRNLKRSNNQRKGVLASSLETNQDDVLRRTSKDLNRKDKTKTAVTQAIKAAEKLLNKKHLENEINPKRLPSEVLEAIEILEPKKKINKKATDSKQKRKPYRTTVTAIGDFVEIPQTPEKKIKDITYIQLPTGKVSVEPVTPKKRSVQACNGTEFRESPVTPYPIGFKVREVPSVENNTTVGEITRKVTKRKRYYDEYFKQNILPKPQWTQSGPFIEEEIPILHQVRKAKKPLFRTLSQKSEKCLTGGEYSKEVALNFKEKAMMRSNIKRSTNREVMLLREHRHTQCRY